MTPPKRRLTTESTASAFPRRPYSLWGKAFCGIVILIQQPDRSWTGKCRWCGEKFEVEKDPRSEAQVLASRN